MHAAGGLEGGRRESSLLTFAALFDTKKRDKRKAYLCFFAGEQYSTPVSATPTHMLRICVNSPTMRVVDGADPYKIKSEYSKYQK